MRRVADAIWNVYLQWRAEALPLSLIGDSWLLTELHRRQLSLIAMVGAQRRRWFFWLAQRVWVFFFFFDRNMAQRVFRNVCGSVEKKTLKTFGACAGY